MKQLMIATVLLAATVAACETKRTTTETNMGDSLTQGMTDTMTADTSSLLNAQPAVTDSGVTSFVQEALSGGMMEVELGNQAASKASSQRVKDFAAMMVADHSQAGNELKQLATGNSINVPSAMLPQHQAHIDMFQNKTGAAFDKAYMDMMVKDHQKDVTAYKKASQDLGVAAYKDFAGRTLPVLEKHLDSAKAIKKSL